MPAKSKATSTTAKSPEPQPTTLEGLLPDPDILARYEKIVPGGAERILELSEQRSAHAQLMAEQTLKTTARTKRIKQVITFVLSLGAGILGGALLLQGSELAGLLIVLIDAAALVGVTIYGNRLSD